MPPENIKNSQEINIKTEPKRKRNELDLQTKLKLIHEVERGEKSKTRVAQDFGIPLTTLVTVYKNRKKIEEQIYVGGALVKRKRVRGAKYANLERNLLKLFRNMSDCNLPLSGPIVKEKANNMAIRLGINDFKCSNGWLQRFKLRNNLIFRKCSNEDQESYNDIENDFKEEEEEEEDDEEGKNITADSLNNTEQGMSIQETEVACDLIPPTIPSVHEETPSNNNIVNNEEITYKNDDNNISISREQEVEEVEELEQETLTRTESPITLLICCDCEKNDKMRPLVICKCSKPRCFKEVNSFDSHNVISKSCENQLNHIKRNALPSKSEAFNSIIILEKVLASGKKNPKNEVLIAFDELSSYVKSVYKQNQLKIDDFFKPKTKN